MSFSKEQVQSSTNYFVGQPVLVKLHNLQYQRPAKIIQILTGKRAKTNITIYKLRLYNAQCISFSTVNYLKPITKQLYFEMLIFSLELPECIRLIMEQALKSAQMDMKKYQRKKVFQMNRIQRTRIQNVKRQRDQDDQQQSYTFISSDLPTSTQDCPVDGCVELYKLVKKYHPQLNQKDQHSLVLRLTNQIRLEIPKTCQSENIGQPQFIEYQVQQENDEGTNIQIEQLPSNNQQTKNYQQPKYKNQLIAKKGTKKHKTQKRFPLFVDIQGQTKTIFYNSQQTSQKNKGLNIQELTESCKQIDGLKQLIQCIQILKVSNYIYAVGRSLTLQERQFAQFILDHSTLIKRIKQECQPINQQVLVQAVELAIKRLIDRKSSFYREREKNDIYLFQIIKCILQNGRISFETLSLSKIIRKTIVFLKIFENQEDNQDWGIKEYNYLKLWCQYWKATYCIMAQQTKISDKIIDKNLRFLQEYTHF